MKRITGIILLSVICQSLLISVEGQTVGGNSDGFGCFFPFVYEGLEYTTCIGLDHDKLWCATTENYDKHRRWGECLAEDLASLPSFNKSTPQNVTVYQGEMARLMCHVYNLQNKKVTWQMKGKHYPLTISTFSFLSDGSVRVENDEKSEWNLIIEKATTNDSGIYQCKVTTQTALLVREVHLTVQDRVPTVAPALTLGKQDIVYVEKGQELKLQCNSTFANEPSPGLGVVPPEVLWFKGDGQNIDSNSLNNIVVHNKIIGKLRISTLTIDETVMEDAGTYICSNTEKAYAEVTVRILNVDVDKKNKRRGTASVAPPRLGQRTKENSSTSFFTSPLLLLLSQFITFMTVT